MKKVILISVFTLLSIMVFGQSSIKTVELTFDDRLEDIISEDWQEIDSIVISGMFHNENYSFLEKCIAKGRLSGINMEGCSLIGDSIPSKTFRYSKESLKHFTFPSKLKSIGEECFSDCYFEEINLPESCENIGNISFSYCPNITSLSVPENITVLNAGVFCNIPKVKEITLPDVNRFQGSNLTGSQIEEIELPKELKEIGPNFMKNSKQLKKVTIHEKVEYIFAAAFADCENLSEVYCLSAVPPEYKSGHYLSDKDKTFDLHIFDNINPDAILYVPHDCKETYEQTEQWKDFKFIVEINKNIDNIENIDNRNEVEFEFLNDGIIFKNNCDNVVFEIFNISGQLVNRGLAFNGQKVTLPKGTFIINTNGRSVKFNI